MRRLSEMPSALSRALAVWTKSHAPPDAIEKAFFAVPTYVGTLVKFCFTTRQAIRSPVGDDNVSA